MPRSRIIFLLIITAAIGVVLVAQILPRLPAGPTPTPLPALTIEVAVNPLAYDWVNEQAAAFNKQQPQVDGQPIELKITQRDGIDIWQTGGVWSSVNHPVAWIPESAFALEYAAETGLRFDSQVASLASTSLVWGIFADRADHVGVPIDWDTLQKAAAQNSWKALGGPDSWGFVKPAFALPQKSTPGYGVLLVAAASKAQVAQLTSKQVSDPSFQDWLRPIVDAVPNFTSLGQRPATVLASRGASVADFALLPESEWVVNFDQINSRQSLRLAYPAYKLIFDMPYAVWAESTAAERTSARQFGDFLIQQAAQKRAGNFGLRPAKVTLADSDSSLFKKAVSAGLSLDNVPGTTIIAPPRSSALGLLTWFKTIRSS